MAPEHPADFPAMSMAESGDVDVDPRTPRKHHQYQSYSQPLDLAHQPISPPVINRQRQASQASASTSTAPAAQDPSVRMSAASPPRGSRGPAQRPRDEFSLDALSMRTGGPVNTGSSTASPSQQPIQRTPKTHTPKKADWTIDKLEERLQALARDLENDTARLTTRQLRMAWKKEAPQQLHVSKFNWFSQLMPKPKIATGGMKFKIKQHGAGRGGKQDRSAKQQKDEFEVTRLKTNQDRVPNYGFHHVEISKNILSPNTMLSFVPHLRDLADEEEPQYRRWLENLESMDNQSGFATLSRQEKVLKTMQKEHGTVLLLYLDYWLEQLSVENCTKSTLIRYMASQADAVTPQQKSSILNSYSDDIGSPRTAETLRMFTEAFDRVFDSPKLEKRAVTLRHVLLLDKSVDTVVDTKKWMKETPNQIKPSTESMTVESFLETYALLGCLICCSHSCEHGEYGVDNERKRFSIEVVGGLEPLLRKLSIETAKKKRGDSSLSRKARKPCGEDCYRNGRPGTRARAWSETETMLLKTFIATFSDTNISIQCATAVATCRPCWDVNRQLEKLEMDSPPVDIASPPPAKIKPVSWYDRFKKMLLGDWQDQTITHDHSRREHFDPCNHEGPCVSAANCSCVANKVMCERFCRCTVATCAIKFTGCACHSQGKTCLQKQKERPCICVQLNRECDPALCGSCGALERSDPRNADNDQLYATGCQNCMMQRGKAKSLILGKSMIENCGYGLFTAEDIAQDEFVIEYVGEIITQDEGVRREARRGDVFDEESNASYLFTLLEAEGIWVDAAIYGNLSRYINHQDEGDKRGLGCNITPKILYVGGEYRIKFTSMRDIKAGEELFFNYGENFPNLTKKLLDEQQEEEKVKKRRSRKNDPNKPKKPRGRPPKKRGRKPKNKAFAKIESDGEDDEDVAAMSIAEEDPFQQPRKRKRGAVTDMSSEEEYLPEAVDSDAPAAAPAAGVRSRAAVNRKRAEERPTTTRSRTNTLFDRVRDGRGHSGPSTEPDSDSEPVRTKPMAKRQPRKARRLMGEVADEDEPKDNAETESYRSSAKRRGGSARSIRQRAQRGSGKQSGDEGEDSDSGAHDTPSGVRTRRQVRNTAGPSPSKADGDGDGNDDDGGDDDDDEDSDEHVVIRRHARKVAAQGTASDSDESSGVIDRTRSRRLPARYSD